MNKHDDTFSPLLHPWAVKLSLRHLSKIKLSNILAGDTCDPISLSNLECYLAYREHSLEKLQFVVWFQDYRKRFFALPKSKQAQSPPPCDTQFSTQPSPPPPLHDPIGHTQTFVPTTDEQAQASGLSPSADIALTPIIPFPKRTQQPPSPKRPPPLPLSISTNRKESVSAPQRSPTLVSEFSYVKPLGAGFANQPFKKECMRIIATFLRPGAVKELPLSDAVRFRVIRELACSTHPDVFLPVYHEMYNILENTCTPRFLAHSCTNVNLPQQLFWFAFGVLDILVGISISLSLIFTVPIPPQSRRSWRLFGSLFVASGVMTIYCAFRGFCSRMYLRGRVQLRVWELQDVDEEARMFWSKILDNEDEASHDMLQEWDPVTEDYKLLDDLGSDLDPTTLPPTSASITNEVQQRSTVVPLYAARNGFNRPPVFGPDKVVQDPRIKAMHRQVINEILLVFVISAVLFSAIVIPVPSPR